MSGLLRCTNQYHNGDKSIGFCLNQNCQHPSLICFKCMRDQHFNHQNDCQGFFTIEKWLGKMIEEQNDIQDCLKQALQQLIDLQQLILKKHKDFNEKCLFFKQKFKENNYNYLQENIQDIRFLYQNWRNFHPQTEYMRVTLQQCEILRQFLLNLDTMYIQPYQVIHNFQEVVHPPFSYPQQQHCDQNLQFQSQQISPPPIMDQKTHQGIQYIPIDTNQQYFFQPQLIRLPQCEIRVRNMPEQHSNQNEQIQQAQTENQEIQRQIIIQETTQNIPRTINSLINYFFIINSKKSKYFMESLFE